MKPYKVNNDKIPKLKLLLYGKPGAGKTTFAATGSEHPALKDVLFINVENGLISVLDKDISAIDVGVDETGKKNHHIGDDLEKVIFALASKAKGFENFKTVVLDSTTELQSKDLEDIAVQGNPFTGKKHDIDARIQEDFGRDTTRLKRLFRMLKDLDLNVIFTAIAKFTYKGADLVEVGPDLTPKVREALMASVDIVAYIYIDDKTGERKMLTEEKGVYRAKVRNKLFFNKLGSTVVNPTLPEIYNKLCEAVNESRRNEQ